MQSVLETHNVRESLRTRSWYGIDVTVLLRAEDTEIYDLERVSDHAYVTRMTFPLS